MNAQSTTRRQIIGGAVMGAGTVALAACGPVQVQRAGQNGTQGGQKGKVVWLVRAQVWENKGQETVFEPAIKQALPNIELERIVVPGPQYIPKINAMATAQESLEIWGFGGNYYDYWWRGLPQDLTPYINADKWNVQEYFQPGLMDIFKINNKYYGLSQLTTYGSVLLYNKDLFDKAGLKYPPVDWEDPSWTTDVMLEYAQKMTKNWGKPDAEYGVDFRLWAQMTSWPFLWGGDSWVPEHYTEFIAQKTNFNSDAVMQSHQFAYDLVHKYQVSPDPAVRKGMEQAAPAPMKTGKIAMSLDGGWQYWQTSDITDFKIGYAALPRAKSNKNINFNDFWIMGRWSTNKDLAWKVMRVLTTVEATSEYSRQSLTPPTPRASLNAWLNEVTKFSGQSVADLAKVTTGAIEKKRSQESPDHLFIQHPKIADTYDQELTALLTDQEKPSTWVPRVARILDETVKGIYDQFKASRPKE
ncbi:MAG TPA: extracellular solute-binding protein [Chloroflexota bacterium]|nr:extracellular solute-binding protein [Chloroflexota bacterium]